MGYELYREVKRHAPETLTHREKLTAMVLADDANDESRTTWNSAFTPETLAFCMVKNERDMRKILARLQDEKVIEHVGGGHNGRIAKFRFLELGPATVGGSERTGYEAPEAEPVQKEPPTEGVGGSFRNRRGSKSNLPTPLSPQDLSSPLVAPEPGQPEPAAAPKDEREISAAPDNYKTGRQIDNHIDNDQAQQVAAAWTAARGGRRNPSAEKAIRTSAAELLGSDWPLADLIALAQDMAAKYPTGRDLSRHADHWQPPKTTTAKPDNGTGLPAPCQSCENAHPAARFNVRLRTTPAGTPCPACHPDAVSLAA
jgi:hypothetical protein